MRLSIDVGGTFTDLVLLDEQASRLLVEKIPSTPGSGKAVVDGIARILERAQAHVSQLDIVFHGFTIATNAWLTRTGARVVLLTTEGYGDILAIGSQRRPHTYDLSASKPEPLVPRTQVVEVRERMDAFGTPVCPLDPDELARAAERVIQLKPESVAISLLFAWANNSHETQLRDALKERLDSVSIYCSSDVDPRIEEYPRTNTTVASAYVGPPVSTYTESLEADLLSAGVSAPLRYMRSDGGAATARSARASPGHMLLSGPAGGVVAALALGEQIGVRNLINFDMGGTSADFSVIRDGRAGRVRGRDLDGLPLRIPMLEINAISAGGGSIGWVDRGGALQVGPASAGAVPGPACYNQGGDRATLTDAAVTLGLLDESWFAGGEMKLDRALANAAIGRDVAEPLGLNAADAAVGMMQVATANMVQAIRKLSTERGDDIGQFSLLAFGGAGGLFAPYLLRELGLREVLIPSYPGVFAALGLLYAELRHHAQSPMPVATRDLSAEELRQALRELLKNVDTALADDGVETPSRRFEYVADMRYVGQHHELEVSLPAPDAIEADFQSELEEKFHITHEQRYGYCHRESATQLTNIHVIAHGAQPRPPAVATAQPSSPAQPFDRKQLPLGQHNQLDACELYQRHDLQAGQSVPGPAILVQADSTLLVLAGQCARTDEFGVVHLQEV